MRAAVVVLLSLAAAATGTETGLIKVIHNGDYRARVAAIQESHTEADKYKYVHGEQELVPYDFKASAPSNETALAATPADPYTIKLQNTTDGVYIVVSNIDLSKTSRRPDDWNLLYVDHFAPSPAPITRCYWLGGTVDNSTWKVNTTKDKQDCTP